MSNLIPTAEEVLELVLKSQPEKPIGKEVAKAYIKQLCGMHIKAALEAAVNKAQIVESEPMFGEIEVSINKSSILNAYPLDNIK